MTRRKFLGNSGAAVVASLAVGTGVKSLGAAAAPEVPAAAPALAEKLAGLVSLYDVEEEARRAMGDRLYDYIASGAADELTVKWNVEKYREIRLRPRALENVAKLDPTLELFGQKLTMPILVAPAANQKLIHPEGELATARGAGLASAAMVLSSGANTDINDVVRAASQPVWFQLYTQPDRAVSKDIVGHAEQAGAKALVITVDSPVVGARNREQRAKIKLPAGIGHPNYLGRARRRSLETLDEVKPQKLDWEEMEWLRGTTKLPLLLKGILTPEDAERAIQVGANGIVVSNHGGRALDTVPATIDALPAVAERVAGRVPVLVDGGIRRGTDVLKALARGATATLVGRPYVYGLAVGGAEGVAHVLKTLRLEFLQAMALTGRPTLKSIDKTVLW